MQTATKPEPQAAQSPKSRMALASIKRGVVERPMRLLVFGTEGIGKSTFAAGAPTPIFLGAEDGTAQLDVARLPEPTCWEDAIDAVRLLTQEEHEYKTLVIDTIDWLEPHCWARVCRMANRDSVDDIPYGRGYTAALDLWREFLFLIDRMRDRRGIGVIMLAHTWIKTFKNPEEGGDYARYELKVHSKAAALIKEWSDAVLFARYETFVAEVNGRSKGFSSGARVLHTERRAAWDAKNRYGLPEQIPLSWDDFAAAVASGAPASLENLQAEVRALLEQVDEPTRLAAVGWLAARGNADDASKLAQMADRLRAKIMRNQPPKEKI